MFVCVLWFWGCCCNAKSERELVQFKINLLSSKKKSMDVPKKEMEHKRREQKYITNTDRSESVTKKDRPTDHKDKRQTLCEESFTKAVEDTSAFVFHFLHLAHLINLCWNWQKFIRLLTHEEAVRFSSYAHPLCFQVLYIDSGWNRERWWNVSWDDKLSWKSYHYGVASICGGYMWWAHTVLNRQRA